MLLKAAKESIRVVTSLIFGTITGIFAGLGYIIFGDRFSCFRSHAHFEVAFDPSEFDLKELLEAIKYKNSTIPLPIEISAGVNDIEECLVPLMIGTAVGIGASGTVLAGYYLSKKLEQHRRKQKKPDNELLLDFSSQESLSTKRLE